MLITKPQCDVLFVLFFFVLFLLPIVFFTVVYLLLCSSGLFLCSLSLCVSILSALNYSVFELCLSDAIDDTINLKLLTIFGESTQYFLSFF